METPGVFFQRKDERSHSVRARQELVLGRRLDLKEDIVISRLRRQNARGESVRLSAVLWVEFAASCVELLFDFSPKDSGFAIIWFVSLRGSCLVWAGAELLP